MSSSFDDLVASLETRYDYQSARSVTRAALAAAGLEEGGKFEDADLQKFADGLNGIGDHLDAVWSSLGVAPTGTAMPAAPEPDPASKADAKATDAKAADAKAADAKAADAGDADAKDADAKDDGDDADAKDAAGKMAPAKKAAAKK